MSNSLQLKQALSNAANKLDKASIYAFLPITLIQFLIAIAYSASNILIGSVNIKLFLMKAVSSYLFTIIKIFFGVERAQDKPISFNLLAQPLRFKVISNILVAGFILAVMIIPLGIFVSLLSDLPAYPYIKASGITLAVYLLARFCLYPYFIIDKSMNFFEALIASFLATRWNFWKLMGAFGINILMVFAIALTIGIGAIWLIPLINLFWGEIYKQLSQIPENLSSSYQPAYSLESEFHLG